jgi:transposase-like protein
MNKRKHYSSEFKQQALALVDSSVDPSAKSPEISAYGQLYYIAGGGL